MLFQGVFPYLAILDHFISPFAVPHCRATWALSAFHWALYSSESMVNINRPRESTGRTRQLSSCHISRAKFIPKTNARLCLTKKRVRLRACQRRRDIPCPSGHVFFAGRCPGDQPVLGNLAVEGSLTDAEDLGGDSAVIAAFFKRV